MTGFDALVVLSFGGPEGPDDVMPFLERVTAGRGIPPERLRAVAAHYDLFGGISPINAANRELVATLQDRLDIPVYWGNRNWHPLLPDTVRQMTVDGITHAACFVTSAYGGYSACRQYRDNIDAARAEVEGAPTIEPFDPFFDHPGFIEPMARRVADTLATTPPGTPLVFSAHSVPLAQAGVYEAQVREASRLVAARVGDPPWTLAWQSRSGPPSQPWLEPDVGEVLAAQSTRDVVLVPIGFVCDHMEVVYDLDTVAVPAAAQAGIRVTRVPTVGVDLVPMICDLLAGVRAGLAPPEVPRLCE